MEYWKHGTKDDDARNQTVTWEVSLTSPNSMIPIVHRLHRGVAQPGSALAWGVRCRRFKSSRPDQNIY